MRIFYFETTAYFPSSAHFLMPLQELGQERGWAYEFFDEAGYVPAHRSLPMRIAERLRGRRPFSHGALNRDFIERVREFAPDVILIGKGRYLAPETLRAVKRDTGAILINWATDDPFNPANSSADLLDSIPLYDLYVSTKRAIIGDIVERGCRNVIYLRFGYKPELHFPEKPADGDEVQRFGCDVAFIGGADHDRAPFFETLIQMIPGLRLNLYGAYWNRIPALRRYWRGEAVGRDYRMALGGASIAVNLVRRSNRDDHVMRTFEIPACGAFMVTERTRTHEELFADGIEAAFFRTPLELVEQVRHYLPLAGERSKIAARGHRKIVDGNNTYRDRLLEIVAAARPLMASADRGHKTSAVSREAAIG